MLYQRLSHDNKITKKFCKNLLAEIERSRIERRNQIVERLREKLFNSYEEEFFSEKLVLGTVKGSKGLGLHEVLIYQHEFIHTVRWQYLTKVMKKVCVCTIFSQGSTKKRLMPLKQTI